ncbi:MAG: hypothetical protein JXJ30_00415 [Halothiobacillaceae bacterium]|nr:hypothetical protein [Halothiobacillaceae bacterium]HER34265.1 hypothetical protein [Halothiobacillaceae bacterium]
MARFEEKARDEGEEHGVKGGACARPGNVRVGVGLLSWRAPATLEATLESHVSKDLFSLFDEHLIFFQERSASDIEVAERFGLRHDGNCENTGIVGGVRALVERLDCEYLLLLENDGPAVESREEIRRQLDAALSDMVSERIPVFRFRSRRDPGEGLASVEKFYRYYADRVPAPHGHSPLMSRLRRLLRPAKARRMLGASAYANCRPDEVFPGVFERTACGNLVVDSRYINWTNQSVLVDRRWIQEVILPYVDAHSSNRLVNGFSDIEKELNGDWWREQEFPVGLVPGVFTHRRLDR